ncbi:hypothetical protein AB1Y20_019218 [Prymnesium parvum]|uniref:Uncharacterized protein n=1 Tax=Prymnesium parvum TaxID=97485 RepID=A0AB34JTG3_PRYPA
MAAEAGAPSGRPRLGASIELFGAPVTLRLEHLGALLVAAAVSGVEGLCALVFLFVAFAYARAAPPHAPPAPPQPRRAPRAREPGVLGLLKHLVGPLPSGDAVSAARADPPACSPIPVRAEAARQDGSDARRAAAAAAAARATAAGGR